jgi:hypothetical protein
MKPVEVLKAADSLLSDESKWTKCAYSRKANGDNALFKEDAVSFCLLGAMRYNVNLDTSYEDYINAQSVFKQANNLNAIAAWNDDYKRTFPEVKAALKKAIEYAEKAE